MNAGDFLDKHDSCLDQVLAKTHKITEFERRPEARFAQPDTRAEPYSSPPKKKPGKTIIIKKKA